jgi:hypothetical protein
MIQMHPVHNIALSYLIHSGIYFPSKSRSSEWFFPSGFTTKILQAFLIASMCATRHAYLLILNLIIRIIFREAYKLRSSKYSPQLPIPKHPQPMLFP